MRKNTLQLLIAGIFIIIFLGLLYMVVTKKIESLDHAIYERVSKLINTNNTRLLKGLTILGSALGIVISMAIACILLNNKVNSIFLIFGMLGEVILNNALKVLVKRIRPAINPLVIESNYSFPSGHTMAITAFYGLIMFFLWKSPLALVWKLTITIISICIILIVAFSRVYLGVHYTSDVLAGICCSIAYLLIITLCYPTIKGFFI